jgi:hypothetical protein
MHMNSARVDMKGSIFQSVRGEGSPKNLKFLLTKSAYKEANLSGFLGTRTESLTMSKT